MECKECKYYSKDDDNCTAFRCDPFGCDYELPCEDTDSLTLYATRGVGDEEVNVDLIDFDDGDPG